MTTTLTATTTGTFQIDKAHSEATFQVRHLITKVRGRFSDFAGTVSFNDAEPAASSVNFTIQAASIDTNQLDRDTHLRSEDFFAVERFPTITFVSRSVAAASAGTLVVTGDLTMRGVTKTIALPVSILGRASDPWGNQRLAFEAETTINRKEFGLNWNAALETGGFLVGDEVRVSLSVQAIAG